MKIFNITDIAHQVISQVIELNDIVIDATAGNGNDTEFLANKVGEKGKVYAFDIQSEAIVKTKQKLIEYNLLDRVTLIQDNHANISKYVQLPISSAMFNLGYLPKSTKDIVTKGITTIKGIDSCVNLLKKNGIITICVYLSHDGGQEESAILQNYLISLSLENYRVFKYYTFNNVQAPYLIYIYRVK